MTSTNMLKVTVAFLAGLVIALGGALIYTRSTEPSRVAQATPPPQAAVPAPAAPAPATTPAQAAPAAPPPDRGKTAESEPAPPVREHKPVHKKEVAKTVKPKAQKADSDKEASAAPTPQQPTAPAPQPVQTAQADPPPPPQNVPPDAAPTAAPPPPPPSPQVVTLQPGTTLKVRTIETLSTEHNFTGDTFRATLESPITRNGYIIADRGSQVLGRIVNAEKAGRVQGLADLTLALTAINTTDGQRISIQTNTTDIKGPASKKRDAAEIAGGSALGAIIGAIAGGGKGAAIGAGAGGGAGTVGALSTRGKDAVVQAETPLTFQLNTPVTITEKMNQ